MSAFTRHRSPMTDAEKDAYRRSLEPLLPYSSSREKWVTEKSFRCGSPRQYIISVNMQ